MIMGVTYVAKNRLNVINSTYEESIKLADNIHIQRTGIILFWSVILKTFFNIPKINEIPHDRYMKVAGNQLKIYIDSTRCIKRP